MPYSLFHIDTANQHFPMLDDLNPSDHGYYLFGSTFADSFNCDYDQDNPPAPNTRKKPHFTNDSTDISKNLLIPVKRLKKELSWDFSKTYQKAFYTGYASHLVIDGVYVFEIWKKYFQEGANFNGSEVHHDVFRHYLDTTCAKSINNKKIITSLQNIDLDKLTKFSSIKNLKIWQKVIIDQVRLTADYKKTFDVFIGDKKRFAYAKQNYQQILPQIKEIMSSDIIATLTKKAQKAIELFLPQRYNPISIIKYSDL